MRVDQLSVGDVIQLDNSSTYGVWQNKTVIVLSIGQVFLEDGIKKYRSAVGLYHSFPNYKPRSGIVFYLEKGLVKTVVKFTYLKSSSVQEKDRIREMMKREHDLLILKSRAEAKNTGKSKLIPTITIAALALTVILIKLVR